MNTVEIIHKDPDFLVINKPPGLPVHGGDRIRGETLVDFLIGHYPEIKYVGDPLTSSGQVILRPGIVHRLDKDTSGVMVVARNQKTFEALKDIFKNRLAEKIYWAVVCGLPKKREGIINYPIGRLIRNPLKRGVNLNPNKKIIRGEREALTKYKVLKSGENYSLLEVVPKTGRMHQIRVHLAAINYPVACDKIYGGKNVCCPEGVSRQLLHAKSLSFSYPEGRKLYFEADPTSDFLLAEEQIV